MRSILIIGLVLFSRAIVWCQVEDLRQLYLKASTEEGIRKFNLYANSLGETDPLIRAYKGVAFAMYAQVVSGVREKYSWFDQGKRLLESAVLTEPDHPEIAFLRFSVQAEVPAILNYKENLTSDANKVVVGLHQKKMDAHSPFWQKAILFMIHSDQLNQLQEAELKRFISS